MIIVRLMGGLGNQMFQYAAGKRLALTQGVELKLDVRYFRKPGYRRYLLDHFHITEGFTSDKELRRFKCNGKPWWSLLSNSRRRQAKDLSPLFIKEKQYQYDDRILHLGKDAYLDGYWQSESYFKDIEREIRETFIFRNTSEGAARVAGLIRSSNSVSLHIRRGDYIKGEGATQVFEILSLEYYRDAVNHIRSEVDSPHLFVFSDGLPWVQENMSFDCQTTIVDMSTGESPFDDMYLMSLCRHNIIANSTFSWWGGWLNENDDKIVIAPSAWFKSGEIDIEYLIPEGWKMI